MGIAGSNDVYCAAHSAYIPTFGATRSVTRSLKRRDGRFVRAVEELRAR